MEYNEKQPDAYDAPLHRVRFTPRQDESYVLVCGLDTPLSQHTG